MAEKLTIKNFAGIKELDIEVKNINILIGPQASGKSICAKLLFYFKDFVWQIVSIVGDGKTKRELDLTYSKKFEEYFPPDSWGNSDFFIRYEICDAFIEISREQGSRKKFSLVYSDFYKQEIQYVRNALKRLKEKNSTDPRYDRLDIVYILRDYLTEYLITSLCKEAAFSQLFIPAGRSFFANLQSSIFSFLSSNNALDPFLRTFGSTYESMKGLRSRLKSRSEERKDIQDEIERLVERALCGKHTYEKGKDFLEISDGRRINIANSSSGQQETLPLVVMLATLPFLMSPRSGRTVYIEEPEAHLFPSAQRNIIELIATVFNYRKSQLQFFITTHSPYILTATNNLLQAGLLYERNNEDTIYKLKNIIPDYKALSTSNLTAYSLINGKGNSILCSESGLIDAKVIDSVSDELAIQFDDLLNLT